MPQLNLPKKLQKWRRQALSHRTNQDINGRLSSPSLAIQPLLSGGYYPSPSGRSYYVYIDGDVYEVDDNDESSVISTINDHNNEHLRRLNDTLAALNIQSTSSSSSSSSSGDDASSGSISPEESSYTGLSSCACVSSSTLSHTENVSRDDRSVSSVSSTGTTTFVGFDDNGLPLNNIVVDNTSSVLSDIWDSILSIVLGKQNDTRLDEHGRGKRKRQKVNYDGSNATAGNEDEDKDDDMDIGTTTDDNKEEYYGDEDYREEAYCQEDNSSECSDVSADPEDLAILEELRKKALTLPGLSRKDKKLLESVFSKRTLQHFHEGRGIFVDGKCAKVGGFEPFLVQALHIFNQVASGCDKEGKLKLKRRVKVPVIKVMMLLCGTDNEDGSTDHLMGLIDEDDPVWSSPTGRIVTLFNDALPSIENDVEYGNGPNKFMTMVVRNNCERKRDKKGKVRKPKHCLLPQVKEVNQVTHAFEEFVSAFPEDTNFYIINGGGLSSEKIFRGMYANDPRVMRYWKGASHLSQYSSPSHFNHEIIKEHMYKLAHYADQLSLFVELMGRDIVAHCQSLGVDATEAKDILIDVFWSSSAACMIGDPEKKAMWNDVLARLTEMRSKGGRNKKGKGSSKKGKKEKKSAKKSAQSKSNGQDGAQRKLMMEAKKGRGDNKEPIQVSYVECGGLKAWGRPSAKPCSVNCEKFALKTPKRSTLFSTSCESCGYHTNWDEINEVPSMEPAVWTSVSKLSDDTDKLCGDGNPGLMIGSEQRGTYGSYEAYGCGAKACGEWKSNYPPETAYFCADCEEKL